MAKTTLSSYTPVTIPCHHSTATTLASIEDTADPNKGPTQTQQCQITANVTTPCNGPSSSPAASPTSSPCTPPTFAPGDWAEFSRTVDCIANGPCEKPSAPSIKFSFDMEATTHNANILCEFQFEMESYIHFQEATTVPYVLEFRPVAELNTLLSCHPDWPSLCHNIKNGIDYLLTSIDNKT
eukprot:4190808-Ditylum_brightwellii.AAC.1